MTQLQRNLAFHISVRASNVALIYILLPLSTAGVIMNSLNIFKVTVHSLVWLVPRIYA